MNAVSFSYSRRAILMVKMAGDLNGLLNDADRMEMIPKHELMG